MNNKSCFSGVKGISRCSLSAFGDYDWRPIGIHHHGLLPGKSDGWSGDDEIRSNQYAMGNFQKPPNHGLHRGEATNRFVELSLAEKVVFTYFLYESLIGSNFIILTEDIHNSS